MTINNIPDYEPSIITAGETIEWTKDAGYLPQDGYALTYYFRGAGPGFNITATDNGDGTFAVTKAVPAGLAVGVYSWEAWAAKDGARFLVDRGTVEARASLINVDVSQVFDTRSQVKRILDAIDAMMLGKATLDQQEYTINNRSLKRLSMPDLIAARSKYAQLYAQELQAEKVRQGAPYFKNILTRFTRPK